MGPRPLAELISPDWAEALAPVAPAIAAMGGFLRAELAAGRNYLPAGQYVLAGPISHSGASGRSVVFGGSRRPTDSPFVAEHLCRATG